MNDRFSYSHDEENYHGEFATREEALAEGRASGRVDATVWTGRSVPPTQPEEWWEAEDWLELVSCQDSYSLDCADGWDESTKEQRRELESLVRPIMAAWLDRHGLRPRFWLVEDVIEHKPEWSER